MTERDAMENLRIPHEVNLTEILKNGFSPRNFKTVGIPSKAVAELRSFLDSVTPYIKGIEPGGSSYVSFSDTSFLRNSCINGETFTPDDSALVYLKPHLGIPNMILEEDVLLCKDANIGECAVYLQEAASPKISFSSGVAKLNFRSPRQKYFVLAALKDRYFLEQLDALTPKGSTIRHAGERFLDCRIPVPPAKEDWIYEIFESLVKNVAYSEIICKSKLVEGMNLLQSEIIKTRSAYKHPGIQEIAREGRIDAGFYSEIVQNLRANVSEYRYGSQSLPEFGFTIKRGPNLARRDLGRSIIGEEYRPGYDVLIYPSDISERGFLLRNFFIGARGAIWHLGIGDILFSAEGTVGRIFAVCDDQMTFTTNFHGIILSNQTHDAEKSAFLAMYLHFLRAIAYFDKVSVGGQGGSFASSYWGLIRIPKVNDALRMKMAKLYHEPDVRLDPFQFSLVSLRTAGVYQLSALRVKCASIQKAIMSDLKRDQLRPLETYKQLFGHPA